MARGSLVGAVGITDLPAAQNGPCGWLLRGEMMRPAVAPPALRMFTEWSESGLPQGAGRALAHALVAAFCDAPTDKWSCGLSRHLIWARPTAPTPSLPPPPTGAWAHESPQRGCCQVWSRRRLGRRFALRHHLPMAATSVEAH